METLTLSLVFMQIAFEDGNEPISRIISTSHLSTLEEVYSFLSGICNLPQEIPPTLYSRNIFWTSITKSVNLAMSIRPSVCLVSQFNSYLDEAWHTVNMYKSRNQPNGTDISCSYHLNYRLFCDSCQDTTIQPSLLHWTFRLIYYAYTVSSKLDYYNI